jgi:hypothetical protein
MRKCPHLTETLLLEHGTTDIKGIQMGWMKAGR